MLMEDFFAAVERAFIKEDSRIPAPHCLELMTPLELPLSALENLPTAALAEARAQPERCRHPVQSHLITGHTPKRRRRFAA
jgi:hypothetical protein